jgi:hypothetical protein
MKETSHKLLNYTHLNWRKYVDYSDSNVAIYVLSQAVDIYVFFTDTDMKCSMTIVFYRDFKACLKVIDSGL